MIIQRTAAKYLVCFLVFWGLLATTLLAQVGIDQSFQPKVSPGTVDLRSWNTTQTAIVPLEFGWQFVWQELLAPADLTDTNLAKYQTKTRSLRAAQRWNQHQNNVPDLPAIGYGSYYLKLLLPENHPPLALNLNSIGSSARVFWNGQEIAQYGIPATTAKNTLETVKNTVIILPESGNEAWLLIQVANWSDSLPGLHMIPRIGIVAAIQTDWDRSVALIYLIAGLFLIMGVYHLCLFCFRRKDRSPLLFAAICFLLCLRILVTDNLHINVLFPIDDLGLILAGSYLTFSLLVLSFVFFITNLFRYTIGQFLRWVTLVCSGCFSLMVLLLPPAFYTQYLWVFQIITITIGLIMLPILVVAIAQRRPNSLLFFLGFLCVLGSVVHDTLKMQLQWGTPSLVPLGIVIFVVFQSLVLTRKSASAIAIAENLSKHLQNINDSMTRFVPREILTYLGREHITDIQLGDHSSQNMAVLFCDIKDFTRISQSMAPEATFQLINRFLAIIGPIIRNKGGFVEEYQGDGVIALFPGHATVAVQAALDMQQAMGKLNAERLRQNRETISIGVGIHFGSLIIGTIGEPQRMDSTVISDAVKVANHLQGLTRILGGQIMVSETTLAKVMPIEHFQMRKLGKFKIYNRSETIEVVEFFDSEARSTWESKRQTRRNFERAVNLYQLNELDQARSAFTAHLEIFPDDLAARYYLSKINLKLSENK